MDDIEITILETDDLPQRKPSYPENAYKKWLSPESASVRVFCSQNVFVSVEKFSKENDKKEVGGVLLGTAYRHNGNIYVEVIEFIKASASVTGQSGVGHFTFTPDTWAEVLREKDAKFSDHRMVGWFHTHPNHGIFLSTMDLSIHEGHFKSPWHIAMVYDPIRHEGGFFIWEKNKIIRTPGFYEVFSHGQKKSIVTWKNPSRPDPQSQTQAQDYWWLVNAILSVLLLVVIFALGIYFYKNKQDNEGQFAFIQQTLVVEQTAVAALKQDIIIINAQIATATPTNTMTFTPTLTAMPTNTEASTPTLPPSPTNSPTVAPTETASATPTFTATSTFTETSSPSVTPKK